MNNLRNNIYFDFMNEYKDQLIEIDRNNKKRNGNGIVLIDFDKFQMSNNFSTSLFSCDPDRLPDYAVAKLDKIGKTSTCFALKHVGLCLITELPVTDGS